MSEPLHDRLDGHVALVSGANRGLGAQVTVALARLGATVFAGARDPAGIAAAEAESDGKIHPIPLDVTDEQSIRGALHTVLDVAGHLDILVNNAGIGDWGSSSIDRLDTRRFDEVMATNVRGPVLMAKHALPHLLHHEGGRIVNVSSGMGALTEGMSGSAPAYRISKTALNGLTASLHGDYGSRGLIVNSVCPGWVRTDMGGPNANRSLEEGADGIVWLCRLAPGATSGRFWRDRKLIDW